MHPHVFPGCRSAFGVLALKRLYMRSGDDGPGLTIAGIATGVPGFVLSASLIIRPVTHDKKLQHEFGL